MSDLSDITNTNSDINSDININNIGGYNYFSSTFSSTFSSFKNNKKIICCNCGKNGHVYKKCFNPITSMGIICFKRKELKSLEYLTSKSRWKKSFYSTDVKSNINGNINSNNSEKSLETLKYLLIRRKDSLAFAEFVRVKYNLNDKRYIKKILENMTIDEQDFLRGNPSPDEIWDKLWSSNKKSRSRINEFNKVKKKLNLLLTGSKDKNDKIFTVKSLLDNVSVFREFPEWGFPKGRRVPKESDIQCSIREFCEETDINSNNINILSNIGPVEETFTGSNNIVYKHIYYVAEIINDIDITINPINKHQQAEIGDIEWFNKKEALEKLELENIERITLFTKVTNYLETLL